MLLFGGRKTGKTTLLHQQSPDVLFFDLLDSNEIKSTEEVQSRHMKNLKVFAEEHPGSKLMIVSLDVFTRQMGNIECIYVMDFFHRLWTDGI